MGYFKLRLSQHLDIMFFISLAFRYLHLFLTSHTRVGKWHVDPSSQQMPPVAGLQEESFHTVHAPFQILAYGVTLLGTFTESIFFL